MTDETKKKPSIHSRLEFLVSDTIYHIGGWAGESMKLEVEKWTIIDAGFVKEYYQLETDINNSLSPEVFFASDTFCNL